MGVTQQDIDDCPEDVPMDIWCRSSALWGREARIGIARTIMRETAILADVASQYSVLKSFADPDSLAQMRFERDQAYRDLDACKEEWEQKYNELLRALKASQKAIREMRENGAPTAYWDDVEADNLAAIAGLYPREAS